LSDINCIHVFDTFKGASVDYIKKLIAKGCSVYVIEPCMLYERKWRDDLYATDKRLRRYKELIEKGQIKEILADELDLKSIYTLTSDLAVETIEQNFPAYFEHYKEYIEAICNLFQSKELINAFKKTYCNQLNEFYAINLLIKKILQYFRDDDRKVIFYPDCNIDQYFRVLELLKKNGHDQYDFPRVQFSAVSKKANAKENIKIGLKIFLKLIGQTIASCCATPFNIRNKNRERKHYKYGLAIISPQRQFKDRHGRYDFLVDGKGIKSDEVVILPLRKVSKEEKRRIDSIEEDVYYVPKMGRVFSHARMWIKLLKCTLKLNIRQDHDEATATCLLLSSFVKWEKIFGKIHFDKFITRCDVDVGTITRNIVFKKNGVQSWYFTDSMNVGCNSHWDPDECLNRHPSLL